jgi:hypothetical protein
MSTVSTNLPSNLQQDFLQDTEIICNETNRLFNEFYPYYTQSDSMFALDNIEYDSTALLNSMKFFKIADCSVERTDDMFTFLNEKIQKFLSAAYSINASICYGVISLNGETSLVMGLKASCDNSTIQKIVEGLLPGIKLVDFSGKFSKIETSQNREYGLINGIPTLRLNDQLQTFDLSPIMRGLNNENYTILVMAKPLPLEDLNNKMSKAIQIKDACSAISKRNVTRQYSTSTSEQETQGYANTVGKNEILNNKSSSFGINLLLVNFSNSKSKNKSSSKDKEFQYNESHSENYSKSISKAINEGGSLALDIQNGFAVELMKLAENSIERIKAGQNTGMWQTTISYSADTAVARDILQGCLYSEISKPNPDILPPLALKLSAAELPSNIQNQHIIIPKNFFEDYENSIEHPLSSFISSQELSVMCTFPSDNVPGFELKKAKAYPLVTGTEGQKELKNAIKLGKVCDGERELDNMLFRISEADLNKHTFICGITGSGKTNTVKHILNECKKPFLVIESAKKEYRNIKLKDSRKIDIYTLGKPELNCLAFNPFYILPGVSPQLHIDYLKDLFNASFSFYGPMPYILEKCLHNIYEKKGWNLTLGYHPYLVNVNSAIDFFDEDYIHTQYSNFAHKYLFPTMQDLKDEVEAYIKTKLEYKGEISDNIKTAIMARLESLCVGSKGYMFNTHEFIELDTILQSNSVFELEGLADDSDKAFTVGLLVIFINEYRQIKKESQEDNDIGLQHLLVIEEAHRLLKNVETERSSENMGNPKGKAVEHFTNMIAEMRSYGQGVIIAEQIPSKLAPDVIKNSSNKIIHRIVSIDDQEFIGNMIGMKSEDAIYLGNQRTGYALCHKEGMTLPVSLKMKSQENIIVKDNVLYEKNLEQKLININKSMVWGAIPDIIEQQSVKLLNSILAFEIKQVSKSIEMVKNSIYLRLKISNMKLIPLTDHSLAISQVMSECMIKLMQHGLYDAGKLIDNQLAEELYEALRNPYHDNISSLKKNIDRVYHINGKQLVQSIITELMASYIISFSSTEEIISLIDSYFILPEEVFSKHIAENLPVRGA